MRELGVVIVGVGWVAMQHMTAFGKNPNTRIRLLVTRDEERARRRLQDAGIDVAGARFTTRFEDALEARDVDIVSISTPNDQHAKQAVASARAGKHILLEKPTGLDVKELIAIRDAVKKARVRTIVSFELHYNPYLRFAHWLRADGWLGNLRFARFQYLSRVTDWYSGWDWVRRKSTGGSHLLAAGCHAVDALRWCTGLEPVEVSAFHTHFTKGYEFPTSIVVNAKLKGRGKSAPLAQVVSSTDFQMPYHFGVEMMGDRATLRDDYIFWNDEPLDLEALRKACPFDDVEFTEDRTPTGAAAIRVLAEMPGSADVSHHPFQGEIDELVACILERRESHLNVHDAQKTMEFCIAADRSADREGARIRLPLT